MILRVERLAMLAGVLAASGCGSSDKLDCSMVSMEGLDPGQTIVSLSEAHRRLLCDYGSCQLGGYGARKFCSGGEPITVARSQSACLASTPTNPACTATVQDLLGCAEVLNASPCSSTLFLDYACAAVTDAACLTSAAALMSTAMMSAPSR
jgi:hypothetical protein